MHMVRHNHRKQPKTAGTEQKFIFSFIDMFTRSLAHVHTRYLTMMKERDCDFSCFPLAWPRTGWFMQLWAVIHHLFANDLINSCCCWFCIAEWTQRQRSSQDCISKWIGIGRWTLVVVSFIGYARANAAVHYEKLFSFICWLEHKRIFRQSEIVAANFKVFLCVFRNCNDVYYVSDAIQNGTMPVNVDVNRICSVSVALIDLATETSYSRDNYLAVHYYATSRWNDPVIRYLVRVKQKTFR